MQEVNISLDALEGIDIEDFTRSIHFQGRQAGVVASTQMTDNHLHVAVEGDVPNSVAYAAAIQSWVNDYANR